MELRELHCQSCGATLNPENIVERLAMARCEHCGAVFALEGLPGSEARGLGPVRERPPVAMPKAIRVENWGSYLEITRSWYAHSAWFLLVFCVFWNGFMIVWHTLALSMGAWFMSCFGLIHTAVGIGIAWGCLAMFLNKTTIRAQRGLIEIRSGPIPCGGNKTFPTDGLEQMYSQEKVSHGKNGPSYTYELQALLRTGQRETLLKGLTDAEQALYIEQQLERYLGIEDEPVAGELPR